MISDINIECYPTPDGANKTGDKAYVYNDKSGMNDSVAITDDNTVLKSLLGSGTNMDADYPKPKDDKEEPAQPSEVATVPGLTGAGPGTNGHPGNDGNDNTVGETGTAGNSGSTGSTSGGIGGFSQGTEDAQVSEAPPPKERGLQSSMFAALVAVMGLLVL